MAGNYRGEARGGGIEFELRAVMKNIDGVVADLDNVVGRKVASPTTLVIIAANRADRCEGSKRIQDCWIANITTMNDEVRVPQCLESFGSNQTMGIRDHADAIEPIRHFDDRSDE